MPEWDAGPPPVFATHFENRPSYAPWASRFRLAWGPISYRGRLDGSAKVIVIGQDPAADEDVARRILVGDAGQRVQGFLRKLGVVRSYAMVNTFLYGLKGQVDAQAKWRRGSCRSRIRQQIAITSFGKLSVSVGCVTFIDIPGTVDQMLRESDLAMYAAKAKGGGTTEFRTFNEVAQISREDVAS